MVEWKKLGDICDIKNGYTPSTKNHEFWDNGDIPWFTLEDIRKNGRVLFDSFKHITSKGVKKSGLFPKDSIIISTTATIGEYALIKSQFLCNQQITCLSIKDNQKSQLGYKFFYYLSDGIGKWCQKNVNGGGSLLIVNTCKLNNLQIPIPSISEQTRIVGILDTFTASIENLKQQIKLRRKQFNWYLDRFYYANKSELLEASKIGEAKVKSLDEIGAFTRGRRFVRTDIVQEGVPCIHYGDMYTYYGIWADKTPTHLTKEISEKLRFAKKGDVVIVAAGENDLDIGVGVAWLGEEDVVVHDACFIFKHNMNPKYLSYFMRSNNYHQQIRMGVVDGKICSISAKELGRTLIAIPSLEEQSRIVSILDTFEASISNLEAQLKQREKQYEYYRNKLLTF